MITLRWFGLYCIILGAMACSTDPQGPAVQHSKKSGEPTKSPERTYVGLKTPPMPKGHETELGYLLGPKDEGRFAIEVVNFDTKKVVWMGRLLYHDEMGRAHWEIIAALPPQSLPVGYQFSGGNCSNENKPQPEIVAILKMEKNKAMTQVQKAWKADPQKGTFEPLSLKGIQCNSEGLNHKHH